MKLLFVFIILISSTSHSSIKTTTHESNNNKFITTEIYWEESLIGNMFYDAEFILKNTKNNDFMIINTYPKGFLIDDNIPKNTLEFINLMTMINKIGVTDDFYSSNETFTLDQPTVNNDIKGAFATSHYEDNASFNYLWAGEIENHSVLIKIITKSEDLTYNRTDLNNIISNLNITDNVVNRSNLTKEESIFNYTFYHYPEITIEKSSTIDDAYRRMNLRFSEEDKISLYGISTVCRKEKIPNELLLGQILDNFGYENSIYHQLVTYKNKKYYFNLGGYDNKNGDFNTATFITTDTPCQHVLTYIAEKSEPILERFLTFADHFEPKAGTNKINFSQLDPLEKSKHAQLLYELGEKYYTLKAYNKTIEFYQDALALDAKNEYFYALLQSHYNLHQYKQGLALITQYQDEIKEHNFTIWKAWFLARLDRPKESAATFKLALDEKYAEDDDLFKYLDQLYLTKDYQLLIEEANRFKNDISDSTTVKLKIAKALIKHDEIKAKSYIEKLLNNESIANEYQYDLYDYLGDIEAFELIEKICKQRINQGYESGILLNYLGDAQNNLGKIEQAYVSMQKAHKLLPSNSIISNYYKSLQKKVGISDVSIVENEISVVNLPLQIKDKINNIVASKNHDSYEYLYSIDANHHVIGEPNKRTIYGKIKIKNDSGIAKNKTLYFGFNQEYENAFINYLRVLDSDGVLIIELDRSTTFITTDEDGSTGDDDKLINIPIPSLSVGVMIEYAFTKENKSPNETQSYVEKFFVSSVTNQYKAIVFEGDINNFSVAKSQNVVKHKISDNLVYWDYSNLPNYRKTPYLPDFQDIFPWIKIASTHKTWQKIGSDYLYDIENKINTKFTEEELLTYKNENSTIEETAINIISFAQKNISYQAIEFGNRALIPNTSRKTLKNKYGDCKDHSVLIYDMLNSAGIKAKLALVNSENEIKTDLPNSGQFNHMVVYLPEINGGVFVDITDKDSSIDFKNPPDNLQGHTALILDQKESKLRQIPQATASNNSISINRIVDEQDRQFIYYEKSTIEGYYASSLRSYLKNIEIDEIESKIIAWVGNYYNDLTIENFIFHNLYDNQKPLILEFTFTQDKEFVSTKLPVFMEYYIMEFIQSPNRLWDFKYQLPFNLSSRTTIKNGAKLKFKKVNESNNTKLMKWEISSNKNVIDFKSTVYSNHLPAKEYDNLVKQSKRSYKILGNLIR